MVRAALAEERTGEKRKKKRVTIWMAGKEPWRFLNIVYYCMSPDKVQKKGVLIRTPFTVAEKNE
jgi:hypothetical protein